MDFHSLAILCTDVGGRRCRKKVFRVIGFPPLPAIPESQAYM